MRARGYTFIEIIITLAVAIIITSIGIARYNVYIQFQSFISSGESLVSCIQQAQQDAMTGVPLSSGTPTRYVMVTVEPDITTTGALKCTAEGFDATATTNGLMTALTSPQTNGDTIFQTVQATNLSLTPGNMYRVIFGSLERGLPVEYTINSITSAKPVFSPQGFPSRFTITQFTSSADVAVATSGSPVTLTNIQP